ncbi:MAG: hypothetical protein J6B31_05160, partial [Bacteroidaceae bacterium]|nr:hypothetical protein [Bacteroidaceae bacterium]
ISHTPFPLSRGEITISKQLLTFLYLQRIFLGTHVYAYTYIMLHKPFTLFTLPDTSERFIPFHRGDEGGEGFGEDVVCIGKEAKCVKGK